MGSEFWEHLRSFVRGSLVNEKAISPEDLDLLHVTDSLEDALTYIQSGLGQAARVGGID
jgi:predicted Rossmann-fold nucleotide-binding protein